MRGDEVDLLATYWFGLLGGVDVPFVRKLYTADCKPIILYKYSNREKTCLLRNDDDDNNDVTDDDNDSLINYII